MLLDLERLLEELVRSILTKYVPGFVIALGGWDKARESGVLSIGQTGGVRLSENKCGRMVSR